MLYADVGTDSASCVITTTKKRLRPYKLRLSLTSCKLQEVRSKLSSDSEVVFDQVDTSHA